MTRSPHSLQPSEAPAHPGDHSSEQARLQQLHHLDLLDTPGEAAFDDLVQLASTICDAPIALISLIDDQRWWSKASLGFPLQQIRRDHSFCTHTIQQPGLLLIEDTQQDPRFHKAANLLGGPGIRFYAGVPLRPGSGAAIGALAVLDTRPRTLTPAQQNALILLARQVEAQITLRTQCEELAREREASTSLAATLQESYATFLAFMDHGPFLNYVKDADGRMLFYNEQMAQRFGITRDAWLGKNDHDVWPADVADSFRSADLTVLHTHTPVETVEQSPLADGSVAFWKSYKFPIQNGSGEWLLAGISVDITAELAREAELQTMQKTAALARELETSRSLLKGFLDNSPNHACIKDEQGRYIAYNAAFTQHFGISEEDWIGKTDAEVLPGKLAELFGSYDQQVLQKGKRIEHSEALPTASGERAIFRIVRFPLKSVEGRCLIGAVALNITEEIDRQQSLKAANKSLKRLADSDALTGLYNRRVFYDRTSVEYFEAETTARPLSVIVLDVDDFKRLNDRFGHSAGDEALRLLGRKLRSSLRPQDVVARIGGEEFAILLPDTDLATAMVRAGHIRAAITTLACAAGHITVSMGVAEKTFASTSPEHLITQADDAMYQAKHTGKDRVVAFHERQADLFQSHSNAA